MVIWSIINTCYQLMKALHLFIILLLFGYSYSCTKASSQEQYVLEVYSKDLKVEKFDSTATDPNRFNHNNRIYKVGSTFIYTYQYFTKQGQPKNFRFLEDDWEFIEAQKADTNEITLEVLSGLEPMIEWISDYNQTLISYQSSNKDNFEITGLIENEANIWMHPPRDGMFRILQLSPYPSLVYPLKEGGTWNWSFKVGNHYADKRWATWDGNITITTTYKMGAKKIKQTQWGDVEVWPIEAEAISELGTSRMTAIFNDNLGFLEMIFVNIDSSKITFKLKEVKQ